MIWKSDLHIHSKYSTETTNWLMKKLGCPEAFTDPKEIYKVAKQRGMNAVTITDHNRIDGCLEIMDLPNTFISAEIATRFPEDRCKVHALVYDITEKQFSDIKEIRQNIYEFQKYLQDNNIYHTLAHPLDVISDKLSKAHFEKLLLLFNHFELNGCRTKAINDGLIQITDSLTPELIEKFSTKHGIKPLKNAHKKILTGGSDDHTGIMIARKYIEVEQASNLQDFLKKVFEEGKGKVQGSDYEPHSLAHNLYSVGYRYYLSKYDIEKFINKDATFTIIDKLLVNKDRGKDLFSNIIKKIRDKKIKYDLRDELKTNSIKRVLYKAILSKHEDIALDVTPENITEKWFEVANSATNQAIAHMLDYILNTAKRGNLFDIFHALGSVGSMYFLMSPYFITYSHAEKSRNFANSLVREYTNSEKKVKIGHFTDTYYDINGVAKTMQQNLRIAKALDKDLTIITCYNTMSSKYENLFGEKTFDPIGQVDIPEYSELSFKYPPFLEMLRYCYDNNFTHFHSATPGPVGLAALAIAKILKKPIYGTYHTAFPQYAYHLSQDPTMEEIGWKYMLWYYNQMDIVFVPSMVMGRELIEKGIKEEKIKLYPRGVNIERFKPMQKEQRNYKKILYVGRVSKEKNLHLLAGAFKKLAEKHPEVKLQIVGDGPYRDEMQIVLKGLNVEFTGYVQGNELVQIYSDADLFVFPSTTDTFGNVALEAQACGTPVIVTDSGGPMENILPNETGIVVKGEDENALFNGMKKMIESNKLEQMSKRSREYMEGRSFESAFLKTWHIYETAV